MTLTALIPIALKASIALIVLAAGLSATPRDATYLFRHPGQLARMILAMNVVMPVFAVALALVFDLHPAVKVALVALALSPVPPIFPNKAFKAGGQEAYTIGLLVTASALAIVFVPLTNLLFERIFATPLELAIGTIVKMVVIGVLVPLAVGIAIRHFWPGIADRIAKPVSVSATVLLVAAFALVLFSAWHAIVSLIGDGDILAFAAFVLVGLAAGHLLGGPNPHARSVLALSAATRHPGMAIALAHINVPDQKLAPAAVFLYLLVSGIAVLPYMQWIKRRNAATGPR